MKRLAILPVVASALALGGCGGSSEPALPAVQAARVFELADFEPAGPVRPQRPVTVSFTIRQPSGEPLTEYQRGSGPHTGVHLIFVRDDLSAIVHKHPPVAADGRVEETVEFPSPGEYRLVVDAYPDLPDQQRNFQLFEPVTVEGASEQAEPPPFRRTVTADGYRIAVRGTPKLEALQAAFVDVTVTDPEGKPARFTPWYGALAHAIFFRADSLDYFHTHVCEPGASGCASTLGGTQVAGTSSEPGRLRVGVLLPVAGTWRLFLQCKVDGHVLTAPFTLTVS